MTSEDEDADKASEVRAQVGAIAKAEARASYERRTEVSIDVPPDVTRAKSQAFLDAISPITHSLGLAGDYLEDLRERLRMGRGATLGVVAAKTRDQIEHQQKPPGEVPIKAMLPILERASLEEPDDEVLTSAWATLIATAATDYDPEVISFSRILAELTPRECQILQHIFQGRFKWVDGKRPVGPMTKFFESEDEIKSKLRKAVQAGDSKIFSELLTYVDPEMPIQFIAAITRGVSVRANWIDKLLKEPFYTEHEGGYEILKAQGLVEHRGQSYSWRDGETPVAVDWFELSELGCRFVARVIPRANSSEAGDGAAAEEA
ncbi:hypothetical protein V6C03_12480 [Methyloligella sp. 2.7D]|uniref:Abi-alpha family protein n=1 Tax=unclassified Methyloligella TaxID=2625955 RepID=UPI00157BE9A9|nr:hypothetical protein [Methyloligella sp. GL2]QKP77399.1 hypothetical protein HT051_07980 [Methyloligella sp. GL2]